MLLLLNLIGRSETFAESDLREKITCLFIGIRVKLHFPFKGPLAIFSKLAFSSIKDLILLWTFEKRDVSSLKILHNEVMPSGRSFYVN